MAVFLVESGSFASLGPGPLAGEIMTAYTTDQVLKSPILGTESPRATTCSHCASSLYLCYLPGMPLQTSFLEATLFHLGY